MKRLLLPFALTATCCAVLASSGSAINGISWSDSQHGWEVRYDVYKDQGDVLSTENGGRSWHRIARDIGFLIGGLRTSVSAGAVVEYHGGVWWTRTNGRHWYQAPEQLINGEFLGSGQFFFWLGFYLHTLYQVQPWPPAGPVPR